MSRRKNIDPTARPSATKPPAQWYGSPVFVAAVSTGVAVLGLTPLFLADQFVVATGCTIRLAACRIPSWVQPVQSAAWAGAAIAAALAVGTAARAARSGHRSWIARLAILAALICTAALILVTLRWNTGDVTIFTEPPPD